MADPVCLPPTGKTIWSRMAICSSATDEYLSASSQTRVQFSSFWPGQELNSHDWESLMKIAAATIPTIELTCSSRS